MQSYADSSKVIIIYCVVVLQKGTTQDVLFVVVRICMLEYSENARAIIVEVFAVKEVSVRLNTKILKSAELYFQWANHLRDISACSILHKTIVLSLAIDSGNFILPEAGQVVKIN